jgi:hypothetical protein
VLNDSTKKRLSPTVTYLLTGLVFAFPTLFAAGWTLPEWAQQNIIAPSSLAIIHALVLGFMLTVAFGVLYQVVPIAFQAPPMPRHVFFWHLPIHICSVLLMIYGFLTFHMSFVATGGLALCIGAILYLFILQSHYRKARNKTFVHRGLSFPVVSLVLVILIGLWQAAFPETVSFQLVFTHALIGGLAFWGGLVLVISYKFIPMFALSHGYKASLPRAKWLYFSGLLAIILGEWILPISKDVHSIGQLTIILGCISGALGILSFAMDVSNILRAKKRKRMVNPMREALAALSFILCGQLLMFLAILLNDIWLTILSVYLFAFGGLVPLIMAYMQKIVPFLWFEYRFSKRPERKTAPLLDDMVPKQLSKIAIILYFSGMGCGLIILLTIRFIHDSGLNLLIRILPGSIMAASIGLLFISLRHVLTIGGPRPED